MFPVMTKLVVAALLSSATLFDPTTPKALSFEANALVKTNNKIRLAISKSDQQPVQVTLRDEQKRVLFQQTLSKKACQRVFEFNVDNLGDGQYELEVSSSEGSIRKQVKLESAPVKVSRVIAME